MSSTSANPIRKVGVVVGTSYFVLGLIDPNSGILQLPLQWLLKAYLHLTAGQVATFFAVALVPWYFKPIAGLISDAFPVFGSRRRFYLVAGATFAAAGSLALAIAPPTRRSLLPIIVFVHAALMIVSTVTGGVLVEEGQLRRATGRLTSLRSVAEDAATLCASVVLWTGSSLSRRTASCPVE